VYWCGVGVIQRDACFVVDYGRLEGRSRSERLLVVVRYMQR
jgi:hypothetical protein